MRWLCLLAVCAACAACERDPGEWVCPEGLATGDLVVTEIGGGSIEIYNASGARSVELAGLVLELVRIDGGDEQRVLVRDSLVLLPGTYAIIDDTGDVYDAGAVDVLACGVLVDRVVWRSRPASGTLSFGGAPDAEANDDEGAWCDDPSGSLGEANPPCA